MDIFIRGSSKDIKTREESNKLDKERKEKEK